MLRESSREAILTMTLFGEIVDLIQAVAWPLAIVAVLIAYRKYFPGLIEVLSRRVSGISWRSFTVTFAVATEVSAEVWGSLKYLADPLTPEAVPDSGNALFGLIGSAMRADSARFDLGTGKEWLTSRLYIFAIVLSELLGVRCLVFTETLGGLPRRFVGLADPVEVRAELERRFEWFKTAFSRAALDPSPLYGEPMANLKQLVKDPDVSDWELGVKIKDIVSEALRESDLLQPGAAVNIANHYLHDDVIRRERPEGSPDEPGWVQLRVTQEKNIREEHAQWITGGAHLESILRDALTTPYVVEAPGMAARELERQAVLQGGQFVAVVDPDGRFKRLLDRDAIVEQLGREIAERGAAN
jgi:hypothetical protein